MLEWISFEKEYEGFPLLLRRPKNLEIGSLIKSLPQLAVVTHKFTKRRPDGLPDPDYNESLFEMDIEIRRAFDVSQMGAAVLVETFGGKRHYYFYVTTKTDVSTIISDIASHYPTEQLSWTVRPDPEWGFLERYGKDFF